MQLSSGTTHFNASAGSSAGNLERVRDQAPATPAVDLYSYSGTDVASPGAGPDAPSSIGTQQGTPTNIFTYDYAGRITSKSSGGENLTYDPLGRLTSVTRSNAPGEVLTYDALGQLVGRLNGNLLTYYIGGTATVTTPQPANCTTPGCPLGTSPAVTVDVHVYAGSRRIASVRAGAAGTGRVLYYHRDRLGSVIASSTDGGVAGAAYRYDVYGSMTVQAESPDTASELGFTGQLRLSGGLYVMGIRIYDAKLRQFLQPDVLNPMTYTYASGDPINFVDPTGMLAVYADHGDITAFARSTAVGETSCVKSGDGEVCTLKRDHGEGGGGPPDPSKQIDWGDLGSRRREPGHSGRERGGGGGVLDNVDRRLAAGLRAFKRENKRSLVTTTNIVRELSNTAAGGAVATLGAAIVGQLAEDQFGTASTTDLLESFSEGGLATMGLVGTVTSWATGVLTYGAVASAGLTVGIYTGAALNGAGYALVAFVGGD